MRQLHIPNQDDPKSALEGPQMGVMQNGFRLLDTQQAGTAIRLALAVDRIHLQEVRMVLMLEGHAVGTGTASRVGPCRTQQDIGQMTGQRTLAQ